MDALIKYKKYPPPIALKGLVDYFWTFEGNFSNELKYHQPTTASIFPKFSFVYEGMMTLFDPSNNDEVNIRSGLQAQTNRFQRIISNQNVGVIGVCFFPHAVPLLFNIPARVITNYNLEITDFLSVAGKRLEGLVVDAKNNDKRLDLITKFLLERVRSLNKDNLSFSSSIHYLHQNAGAISIDHLSSKFCLSQRQFERKFKEQSGFTPKMFSRITRFENSISRGFKNIESLTELAHFMGYYDQSHFIRDFKEFTGKRPRDYFSNDLSIFMS